MFFNDAGNERQDLRFRRILLTMVLTRRRDDHVDDVWKTTTTLSPLGHRRVDAAWRDETPAVIDEKVTDDFFNLALIDEIAAADDHGMRKNCTRIVILSDSGQEANPFP